MNLGLGSVRKRGGIVIEKGDERVKWITPWWCLAMASGGTKYLSNVEVFMKICIVTVCVGVVVSNYR